MGNRWYVPTLFALRVVHQRDQDTRGTANCQLAHFSLSTNPGLTSQWQAPLRKAPLLSLFARHPVMPRVADIEADIASGRSVGRGMHDLLSIAADASQPPSAHVDCWHALQHVRALRRHASCEAAHASTVRGQHFMRVPELVGRMVATAIDASARHPATSARTAAFRFLQRWAEGARAPEPEVCSAEYAQ